MGEIERSREDIEAAVRSAFAGVRLGRGISLTVAEAIDDRVDPSVVEGLRGTESDEDWTAIDPRELERAESIAYLDAEVDQREPHPDGFLEFLSPEQRRAVALYVQALPGLVPLEHDDAATLERSFRAVWARELDVGGKPE